MKFYHIQIWNKTKSQVFQNTNKAKCTGDIDKPENTRKYIKIILIFTVTTCSPCSLCFGRLKYVVLSSFCIWSQWNVTWWGTEATLAGHWVILLVFIRTETQERAFYIFTQGFPTHPAQHFTFIHIWNMKHSIDSEIFLINNRDLLSLQFT